MEKFVLQQNEQHDMSNITTKHTVNTCLPPHFFR